MPARDAIWLASTPNAARPPSQQQLATCGAPPRMHRPGRWALLASLLLCASACVPARAKRAETAWEPEALYSQAMEYRCGTAGSAWQCLAQGHPSATMSRASSRRSRCAPAATATAPPLLLLLAAAPCACCRDKDGSTAREHKLAVALLRTAAGLVGKRAAGAGAERAVPVPVPGFPELAFEAGGYAPALRELSKSYQVTWFEQANDSACFRGPGRAAARSLSSSSCCCSACPRRPTARACLLGSAVWARRGAKPAAGAGAAAPRGGAG